MSEKSRVMSGMVFLSQFFVSTNGKFSGGLGKMFESFYILAERSGYSPIFFGRRVQFQQPVTAYPWKFISGTNHNYAELVPDPVEILFMSSSSETSFNTIVVDVVAEPLTSPFLSCIDWIPIFYSCHYGSSITIEISLLWQVKIPILTCRMKDNP